jgi:muramoyltetrapeptide carboxypeptidase LdcA involved in peptidoglycan recycling
MGALRMRGVFKKIRGLVVGQMTNILNSGFIPSQSSLEQIILEHTSDLGGPIIFNAPIGHEHPNIPFSIGIRARVTADAQGARIELLESPFCKE